MKTIRYLVIGIIHLLSDFQEIADSCQKFVYFADALRYLTNNL